MNRGADQDTLPSAPLIFASTKPLPASTVITAPAFLTKVKARPAHCCISLQSMVMGANGTEICSRIHDENSTEDENSTQRRHTAHSAQGFCRAAAGQFCATAVLPPSVSSPHSEVLRAVWQPWAALGARSGQYQRRLS